jgi:epoxyqueuosine reductase
VDTGPIVERVVARHAGLGWLAKNTCLINEQLGSWLFLGVIITTLELAPSLGPAEAPPPDLCGQCSLCIDACPTSAIVEPYVLDARRCISYLTIELRGNIPADLRAPMGRHVFGCDICQDVCPWNRRRQRRGSPAFEPRPGAFAPDLAELAALDQRGFSERFKKSPLKRAKRRGLLRNVAVAIANAGDAAKAPLLERLARDEDAVVREHARWALERLRG